MEISNNNLVPTLSAADSPSQLSEENPQAKNAKKKVPGEESSFDGALAATVAKAEPQPTDLGKLAGGLSARTGKEAADQVELSTKGKATAAKADDASLVSAANAAKAEAAKAVSNSNGAPAPTIASLFQAKAEESAKGPMASAFVAGPDQPWGSRWVFAGGNQPAPEEIQAARTSGGKPAPMGAGGLEQLKKLVAAAQAQGGDESQLKQAAESTLQGIDSAIAELGGEIEGVRTKNDEGAAPKAVPNVLGGAEFISALQGAKGGNAGANGGGFGGQGSGNTADQSAVAMKLAAKPNLQVLPGGAAGGSNLEGGRIEGGLRLAKEEPKLNTETFYPSGLPPTAARTDGQIGAVPPQTITGHVVPGAMMRDRLTSESLRNVSNGIASMKNAGGGEMRIKMNPGNLGELTIRVTTDGKDVGLKVQANDPAAKKVIEESLSSLRDSLASQNLSLGRVDVTVATSSANPSDLGQNSQQNSSNHSAFAGFDGRNPNQGRSMDGFEGGSRDERPSATDNERSVSRGVSSRIAAMNASGRMAAAAADSRLDVMA